MSATTATTTTLPAELQWLDAAGARFVLVKKRDKAPFEKEWQRKPYRLSEKQVQDHLAAGGNIGQLTGHGDLCMLDVDRLFGEFERRFPHWAKTLTVYRAGALDRAKLVVQVIGGEPPKSAKYQPDPKEPPFAEWLSFGRQGVIPPSTHPSGEPYLFRNSDQPPLRVTPAEIVAVWGAWTGEALDHHRPAPQESAGADLVALVKREWASAAEVFAFHGMATEPEAEPGAQVRLHGNGGLICGTGQQAWRWYCHADQTGGDQIDAWGYARNGAQWNRHDKRLFAEVLKEMAEAAGLHVPEAPHRNGKSAASSQQGEPVVIDLLGSSSDEENARLTFALHGRGFMHTGAYGWLKYTGSHWAEAGAEAAVDRAIVSTLEARIRAALDTGEAEKHDKLIKFCVPNSGRVKGAKYNLTSLAAATAAEFDANPDLLNTPAGVVNLRSGEIMPHSPDQRFMHVTSVAYDPGADQSAWLAWLIDTFNGDQEVVNWLQLAAGYSLTGHTSEEVLFYLHGKPRAGKGLFTETMQAVLGHELSAEVGFDTFTRDRSGDTQNFDLAPLKTARFVAASESLSYERFHEAKLKRLTGGNLIYCAYKHRDMFNYKPAFKIWLSSNHPINADPDDDAVWSRIRLIEFPNSYLGREDKRLKIAMLKPEALRGVLAWLIAGARRWYALDAHGIPELQRFAVAKDEHRSEVDYVQQWLEDDCTTGSGWTRASALHSSYREWCNDNGVQAKSTKALSQALKLKGFEWKRTESGRGFLGVMRKA